MFGRKTKRIKELEKQLNEECEYSKKLFMRNSSLSSENENLRLDNGRLRNEVGRLQSQVQRLGLVRDTKGQFRKAE